MDEILPAHSDAPASSSREAVSETRQKVVSGKHIIFTSFPKDRNCDICMRTKITRAPCRKRTDAAVLRAEKFGDSITADHEVLNEGCESRDNYQYAVVVQDLPFNGINLIHAKRKLLRKQKRSHTNSQSRRGNQKSFTQTILQNLAKFVQIIPGIIVPQHLTVQNQMGLVRERCAELRKVLLQYRSNPAWMRNGGMIPWSVSAICEIFRIFLSDGQTPYERRFGEPLKGPMIPFGSMVEYHPISAKDLSRLHQFGKKR